MASRFSSGPLDFLQPYLVLLLSINESVPGHVLPLSTGCMEAHGTKAVLSWMLHCFYWLVVL